MVDMAFDRSHRDHELLRNRLVGSPARHEAQHFKFAFAETFADRAAEPSQPIDPCRPRLRAFGMPMTANIRSMYSWNMPRLAASREAVSSKLEPLIEDAHIAFGLSNHQRPFERRPGTLVIVLCSPARASSSESSITRFFKPCASASASCRSR